MQAKKKGCPAKSKNLNFAPHFFMASKTTIDEEF